VKEIVLEEFLLAKSPGYQFTLLQLVFLKFEICLKFVFLRIVIYHKTIEWQMNNPKGPRDIIVMAPLQGLTEAEFRRAWSRHFSGIHQMMSPFIALAEGSRFRQQHLRDVLPEANPGLTIIPQVLGNDVPKFVLLAHRLQELGYATVNWNLGCPKPSVARKKRGSGLLPFPDLLRQLLDEIIPALPIALSIKTRLGYHHPEEFEKLTEVFNDYPLQSLVIHPRIGMQMYDGAMHLETFDAIVDRIKHPWIFSGDITDRESFLATRKRYPTATGWMLGRGVLANPFLAEQISLPATPAPDETHRHRLHDFYYDLMQELADKGRSPLAQLGKKKDYWWYFVRWFTDSDQLFERFSHLNDPNAFDAEVRRILLEQPIAPFESRGGNV
jgi:tRNA-dihydrouridine synthase